MKNVTVPERQEICKLIKISSILKKKNMQRLSSTSSVTCSSLKMNFILVRAAENLCKCYRGAAESGLVGKGNRQQAGKSRGKYIYYVIFIMYYI